MGLGFRLGGPQIWKRGEMGLGFRLGGPQTRSDACIRWRALEVWPVAGKVDGRSACYPRLVFEAPQKKLLTVLLTGPVMDLFTR